MKFLFPVTQRPRSYKSPLTFLTLCCPYPTHLKYYQSVFNPSVSPLHCHPLAQAPTRPCLDYCNALLAVLLPPSSLYNLFSTEQPEWSYCKSDHVAPQLTRRIMRERVLTASGPDMNWPLLARSPSLFPPHCVYWSLQPIGHTRKSSSLGEQGPLSLLWASAPVSLLLNSRGPSFRLNLIFLHSTHRHLIHLCLFIHSLSSLTRIQLKHLPWNWKHINWV